MVDCRFYPSTTVVAAAARHNIQRHASMKIARIEHLHADTAWRTFDSLKVTTDAGLVSWSEFMAALGKNAICRLAGVPESWETVDRWLARPLGRAPLGHGHQAHAVGRPADVARIARLANAVRSPRGCLG